MPGFVYHITNERILCYTLCSGHIFRTAQRALFLFASHALTITLLLSALSPAPTRRGPTVKSVQVDSTTIPCTSAQGANPMEEEYA